MLLFVEVEEVLLEDEVVDVEDELDDGLDMKLDEEVLLELVKVTDGTLDIVEVVVVG